MLAHKVIDQYEKYRKGVSAQTIVTFNCSFGTGCLKFEFLNNIIIVSFFSKLSNFGRKSYHIDWVKKFCFLQNSAVAFFMYGGQVYNNQCQMPSGFCIPKVIKISSFLTELDRC